MSSEELQQRMDANALILRDMLAQFQRELVAIYDSMRHKDMLPLLEQLEQVKDGIAALATEQANLVAEKRRRHDTDAAIRAGITGLSAQLGEVAARLEAYIAQLPPEQRQVVLNQVADHEGRIRQLEGGRDG